MASEHARIQELRRIFASKGEVAGIELGIGDDCALLEASSGSTVLSVDAQVEGTHFQRSWLSPEDTGYRSLTSALSDLAAMAARPRAALCALIAPPALDDEVLYGIARGMAQAAERHACPIVGGNLARGSELSLTTTVIGELVGAALMRTGAAPGDELFVIGALGMAALGRHALAAGKPELAPNAVQCFRRPEPLLAAALEIAPAASAAIDVSDGLLQDLAHLAQASNVGFELDAEALPLDAELTHGAALLGLDPLTLLLTGGEDYALLFTAKWGNRPSDGVLIGRAVAGRGISVLDHAGKPLPLPDAGGFDHFRT